MSTQRKFLVFCPLGQFPIEPELFGENRQFDVALNFFSGEEQPSEAEWSFAFPGYKLATAAACLKEISREYDYCALIDDDITVSTDTLNELFRIGQKHQFALYQPALTTKSYVSWPETYQQLSSGIRSTRFVEMMVPFFSAEALALCIASFEENLSGWGVDRIIWPKILRNHRMAIIDSHPVTHLRPFDNERRQLSNGKTNLDEFEFLVMQHGNAAEILRMLHNRITYSRRGLGKLLWSVFQRQPVYK